MPRWLDVAFPIVKHLTGGRAPAVLRAVNIDSGLAQMTSWLGLVVLRFARQSSQSLVAPDLAFGAPAGRTFERASQAGCPLDARGGAGHEQSTGLADLRIARTIERSNDHLPAVRFALCDCGPRTQQMSNPIAVFAGDVVPPHHPAILGAGAAQAQLRW